MQIDHFTQRLLAARHSRQPLHTTTDEGPADAATAYAVQAAAWQSLVGDRRPTAWKVGATSQEVTPTSAPILPTTILNSPAHVHLADYGHLSIEAELAVCFGRDLPLRPTPYTRDEILDAIVSVHVAVELVDSRLADSSAAGPWWNLADNLVNAGLLLGDALDDWRERDLTQQTVNIALNGQPLTDVMGKPPLNDIFHCLSWWIDHVGGAQRGNIVTTGAWTGAHRLTQAGELVVRFGTAEARLTIA